MFGPRAFYALALLLIIGGVAAYTRDPDWNLPTGPKAARVASPSGVSATPGASGTPAASAPAAAGSTTSANKAAGGAPTAGAADPAAKPAGSKAADANGAPSAGARPAFRRITGDSRDSTASVETSRPNPTSANGLLGDPAAPSGAKAANADRTAPAAVPEAHRAPAGAAEADDAAKPPSAQAGKEPAVAKADADREVGKKVRKAKRRLPAKVVARRKPWGQPTATVARPGGAPYTPSYGACRLEMRWATTAVGFQPIWARICN